MTAYQRGNRDGLLSFANRLGAMADQYAARLDAARASYRPPPTSFVESTLVQVTLLRDLESAARRAAEALPLDPDIEDSGAG